MLPHYILFKGNNLWDTWCKDGPKVAVYNCSENGWMEGPQFSEWFHKVFLKSVEHIAEPKLLIVDGHKSHTTSIEVVESAIRNNVTICTLQAETTHATQPIDRSVARPFKQAWREIVFENNLESGFQTINKGTFSRLFAELDKRCCSRTNIVAGFEVTGKSWFSKHLNINHLSIIVFPFINLVSLIKQDF
jgi:hypothetical protein